MTCCYNPCSTLSVKTGVWLCLYLSQKYQDTPHPGPRTIPPAAFYNVQRFLLGHNKRINFAFFSLFIAAQLFFQSAFSVWSVQHHLQREKLFIIKGRKYLYVLGTLKYVVRCKGGMYASVLLEMEAGRITENTGGKGWCDLLRTMCNVTLSDRNIMWTDKWKKNFNMSCSWDSCQTAWVKSAHKKPWDNAAIG